MTQEARIFWQLSAMCEPSIGYRLFTRRFEKRVGWLIPWGAGAEKDKLAGAGVMNAVPQAGRNGNGIARTNHAAEKAQRHLGCARQNVVNLLSHSVVMGRGGLA